MPKEAWVSTVLALLGLGVMAGQGFTVNLWVIAFWALAAVTGIVGWLRHGPSSESPVGFGRLNQKPTGDAHLTTTPSRAGISDVTGTSALKNLMPEPVLSIDVAVGVAAWRGKTAPSAELVISNSGQPCELFASARLVAAAPGFVPSGVPAWEYGVRQIKGGRGRIVYCMATLEHTTSSAGATWLVKVRGEHMDTVQRWEGPGELWFETEWSLQQEWHATLRDLATALVRVSLTPNGKSFSVTRSVITVAAGLA